MSAPTKVKVAALGHMPPILSAKANGTERPEAAGCGQYGEGREALRAWLPISTDSLGLAKLSWSVKAGRTIATHITYLTGDFI